MPPSIVLATLNARCAHASLALRYLRANLGALREVCVLRELVVGVEQSSGSFLVPRRER
jgi:hypothetical protein